MDGKHRSMRDRGLNLIERSVSGRRGDVAFLCEVGSTVHGLGIGDQDDLDLTAVRVEPWDEFVLGSPRNQSIMIRTADKGARSGPDDIDINVYTVRKWATLLAKSNPSMLNTLFVPDDAVLVDKLGQLRRDLRGVIVSKEAARRFIGYMTHQMERWRGLRGQRNVNRPELVEAYGFDTKYAAHVIRLGYQGAHFLQTGTIPIPLPSQMAEEIRYLRTGGMSETEALAWADSTFDHLRQAELRSLLPDVPSWPAVVDRVSRFYRDQYERRS